MIVSKSRLIEITTFSHETTRSEIRRSNPVISVILSQLHRALVWNCICSSQWGTFRRSFPDVFVSECFVFHFIDLFLNERDVLNQWFRWLNKK